MSKSLHLSILLHTHKIWIFPPPISHPPTSEEQRCLKQRRDHQQRKASRDQQIVTLAPITTPSSLQPRHQMRHEQRKQPTEERKQTAANSHESNTLQSAAALIRDQMKSTPVSNLANMICTESQLSSEYKSIAMNRIGNMILQFVSILILIQM
jgi:hypothetical protein